MTVGFPFQTRLDVQKDFNFAFKSTFKYGSTKLKPITIMNELYHIFPGSPVYESPEAFEINLKYNSFFRKGTLHLKYFFRALYGVLFFRFLSKGKLFMFSDENKIFEDKRKL